MAKTYDPSQVNLYISGILVTGYAEDTFIEIKRNEPLYKAKYGVRGDCTRTRNPNKSGTITFHLLQSSTANEKLSALVAADEIAGAGTIVFPVMVKDSSGTSITSSPESWLVGYPDEVYAKETKDRTWIIECANLLKFVGGNS